MENDMSHRLRLKWIFIILCWSLIAVFFAARNIVSVISLGQPVLWSRGVFAEIIYWEIWALLTPLIFWFARRFPLERKYWAGKATRVALFGLVLAPLQVTLEIAVSLSLMF